MRTISEHISGVIRRVGKRFKRFSRVAVGRVRTVLKRVRGGVRHRHMEAVRFCAAAITERCHSREAEMKRGLPGGKPVSVCKAPNARDVSVQRPFALPFQPKITGLSRLLRRAAAAFSDHPAVLAKCHMHGLRAAPFS